MAGTTQIKILVVDDREDNLMSIEAILEKDNYTIVKAQSGLAALKILLHQEEFSLILMDVQMPGMNGFETANIIYERDKFRNIPIIFITAHDQDEAYIFKGYEIGGVDYIFKPVNPELLRMKVGVFVDLYTKNRQLIAHEQQLLALNNSLQKEIEERKSSEEKIKSLNIQLTRNNSHLLTMNEKLDRFAFVASHDLQEPLRKILVFTDRMLQKGTQEGEVEKYLGKISSASARMQTLIHDLLAYSRQSPEETDFKDTDLNLVLKDVMNEMEISIEKNNALILAEDLPVIQAAPSLIHQLFSNLLSNAIKFRKKTVAPVINIKTQSVNNHKENRSSRFLQISISDNGIGFDPRYKEEIFVVFKRLHSYHEIEGTGVGLSLCKKIMEIHSGTIAAEGIPGEGTKIVLRFPEDKVLDAR